MILGLLLKGMNSIYFGNILDFFVEFIPQLIFMVGLFGYMNFMIIIKWLHDWRGRENFAPSIITQLLDIFLSLGSTGDKDVYK